ncbi:chorion peroxidase-like [Limulus polyphemus]|uniref:Chorion peroxidase-like n=1 Tax=Limulus polyphemus TaxID=6850 RepID=A0ABM1S860_LIMPO|nr:chorion peroxidase-like [Limulus polyphemus]
MRYQLYFVFSVLLFWNSVLCLLNSISNVPPIIGEYHDETSSKCALILRRTSIQRYGRTPAHPYGGFFDFLKPRAFLPSGPLENVCIRYSDVNRALAEAKHQIGYRHPPTINSLEPHPAHIDKTGELVLATTKLLARQFQLSRDEIINGLPMIDTSRTDIWEVCPAHLKPLPCTMERYRTYTGVCNNMQHTSWGSTHSSFVRHLPPAYSDGISAPRVSVVDGGPLPLARMVSTYIHRDFDTPSGDLSILLMSWGQFIDHDMTLAASPRDENELDFTCCGIPKEHQHPNCMTIDIPPGDPFYAHYGETCIEFKRALAGHRPGCALGPRVHINLLTQSLDANFLYGSTEKLAKELRLGKGGLMRVWDYFENFGLKPLLPPLSTYPEKDCTARPRHLFCFNAGDERVNEQIHLTVLHTLYVRDHNRIATELSRLNPHWDDERIYHETRHIMAASVQHITYTEFLPMILGEETAARYDLTPHTHGYWNGYDSNVHMGMSSGFQSAAFRFGHTFIQGMVRRYNKYHEFVGEDPLRTLLRQPYIFYEPGKIDELIGGLINTPAQTYDPFITQEVTNHLFEEPHIPFGMDLVSFNIMRGRETGVPGYNFFREWCGLGRAKTFEELEPVMNNGTAYKFAQLYKHPDDIDLWSGGISEHRLPGGLIGPTFACIIARQFVNVRKGDRFWYENSGFPSAFTPEQLQEIRKSYQAKIICQNADDMPTIQLYVMRLPHPI